MTRCVTRVSQARHGKVRPAFLGLEEGNGPAGKIPSRDLERAALAGHHREDDGIGLLPVKFIRSAGRHCNENDGKGDGLPVKLHDHGRLIGHGARCDQSFQRFRQAH